MNLAPMPVSVPVPPAFSLANRPRHTRRTRWLAVGVLAALALGMLVHCAAPVASVPPRARMAPAAAQPSAVPTLEHARRMSAQADLHAHSASARVSSAKSGLGDAHSAIQSLTGEVERLHRQKSASENELLALYNRLVEQEKRFAILVSDLTDAEIALEQERALRQQAAESLVKAESMIHAKEAEATQLRGQLDHAEQVADAYSSAAERNARLAAAESSRADQLKGQLKTITWMLVGASLLCLVSLIFNYFQFRVRLPI